MEMKAVVALCKRLVVRVESLNRGGVSGRELCSVQSFVQVMGLLFVGDDLQRLDNGTFYAILPQEKTPLNVATTPGALLQPDKKCVSGATHFITEREGVKGDAAGKRRKQERVSDTLNEYKQTNRNSDE